jgi:CRISPR-associated protein Csc2
MFLTTLESLADEVFHQEIPKLPMGKYAHIVVLRETMSYALFQTDGELNTSRVSKGRAADGQDTIRRIVLFKRKQSASERLSGRELLRKFGIVESCEYNTTRFCKRCPDCIFYGFAIGDQGAERSKVLFDSAFSLTGYDQSHQELTFNAPAENGTMSEGGEMRNALNSQDHVLPQVYFPSVVTIKDPTEAEFIYVLTTILHSRHYGAQRTRTGTMQNIVTDVVFASGEIFSNLQLTQAIYDALTPEERAQNPLQRAQVLRAMGQVVPDLLQEDSVAYRHVGNESLLALLGEVQAIVGDEARLKAVLEQADSETRLYAREFGVDLKDKEKARK